MVSSHEQGKWVCSVVAGRERRRRSKVLEPSLAVFVESQWAYVRLKDMGHAEMDVRQDIDGGGGAELDEESR